MGAFRRQFIDAEPSHREKRLSIQVPKAFAEMKAATKRLNQYRRYELLKDDLIDGGDDDDLYDVDTAGYNYSKTDSDKD